MLQYFDTFQEQGIAFMDFFRPDKGGSQAQTAFYTAVPISFCLVNLISLTFQLFGFQILTLEVSHMTQITQGLGNYTLVAIFLAYFQCFFEHSLCVLVSAS